MQRRHRAYEANGQVIGTLRRHRPPRGWRTSASFRSSTSPQAVVERDVAAAHRRVSCDVHANAALIDHFYESFARKDAPAMARCIRADAHFHDPIFDLKGADVAAMWTMFCERGRDLRSNGAMSTRTTPPGRPTGGALHVLGDRPQGPQSHRFAVHVSRWADRRRTPTRSPLAVEPDGARAEGVVLGWTPFVKKAISPRRARFDGWLARRRRERAAGKRGAYRAGVRSWSGTRARARRSRTTARRASASC
jgi:hypothetical protein